MRGVWGGRGGRVVVQSDSGGAVGWYAHLRRCKAGADSSNNPGHREAGAEKRKVLQVFTCTRPARVLGSTTATSPAVCALPVNNAGKKVEV